MVQKGLYSIDFTLSEPLYVSFTEVSAVKLINNIRC